MTGRQRAAGSAALYCRLDTPYVMALFDWLRPPRHLLALFLLVTVLPALALGWLAWIGLSELDRQNAENALEAATGRVVSDLRQGLDSLSRELPARAASASPALPDDSVVLVVDDRAGIVDRPSGRLLYVPQAPATASLARTAALDAAVALEERGDVRGAAAAFRAAAASAEPSTQAAALIGLARSLRRDGRLRDALGAYDRLAALGNFPVLDAPAALVARRARLVVLDALGSPDLSAEARTLHDDLLRPAWRLDRAAFEFYLGEVQRWLPAGSAPGPAPIQLALTETAASVAALRLRQGRAPASGWTSIRSRDTLFVAAWLNADATLAALVTGPDWLKDKETSWAADNLAVSLIDADGRAVFGRLGQTDPPVVVGMTGSGLPWDVRVAYDDSTRVPSLLARSRYLMFGGLAAAALFVSAGGVLVTRALSRELAVARLQSDFVAAVSHEFRSPLTSMKHLIEMLVQGDVPSEERRQRYYEVLDGETDRLRGLVEDLLNFGRMEAGKAEYHFEPIDIRALVRDVAVDFCRDADAGARLVASVEGPSVTVTGDRAALSRAVRNLLDNAAKYSPAHAPIHLDVEAGDVDVAVHVRDEGPGIAPAEQKRIFTKFYRGAGARKSGVRGTGLGLATVLHLVEAHRGKVRVESAPGTGSTFTIALPVRDGAPA